MREYDGKALAAYFFRLPVAVAQDAGGAVLFIAGDRTLNLDQEGFRFGERRVMTGQEVSGERHQMAIVEKATRDEVSAPAVESGAWSELDKCLEASHSRRSSSSSVAA